MMKKQLIGLSIGLALIGMAGISNAAIEDLQDQNGVGYFLDKSTGFKWVDIDAFSSFSYNDVAGLLATNDFHIATGTELSNMLASAGTIDFDNFASIMGSSSSSTTGGASIIWGFYDNGNPANDPLEQVYILSGDTYWNLLSTENKDFTDAALGAWVVNSTPIPIPATVWLLGAGLAGLASFRRKTKT